MNRFVKDNVILVFSIASTIVVALGLLVYGIIEWISISELIEETEELRTKIHTLQKVYPAPVDGNKQPIQDDTKAYVALYNQLTPVFDSPLRSARNAFLKVLYNLKDTDNYDEAAKKFLDTYNERVRSDASPTQRRMEWDKMRSEIPNWEAAADAFRKAALKAGIEPENIEGYVNEIVLAELGIPRAMNEDKNELEAFIAKTCENMTRRLGERLNSDENYGIVAPQSGFAKGDYPLIARHAAILNNIIGRVADSKIKAFNGIVIRGFGGETLGSSFVEENGCRISHYTFEVTGTLDSIRQLAASFDKAQQDNRFYIVRSVFLYGQDEDLKIKSYVEVKQVNKNSEEQADQPREGGLFGGGRRARLARQKQIEEEQRSQALKKSQDAVAEAMRKREESLALHERHGYGDIELGNIKEFRAVIDVDYIERI